jgi:hypothetical protein
MFAQSTTVMGYCITLVVLSIIAGTRGHSVWNSSVKETDFFAPGAGTSQPQMDKSVEMGGTGYPPPAVPAQGYQGASYA